MSAVQLYNTRTRARQTFVPAEPSGHVALFLCGPTVDDLPHVGRAKTYTQFDFLVRLLRACRGRMCTWRGTQAAPSLGRPVPARDTTPIGAHP
jgi:cysteinyl-tRNA synthetase